jgi:hypothetical protein
MWLPSYLLGAQQIDSGSGGASDELALFDCVMMTRGHRSAGD